MGKLYKSDFYLDRYNGGKTENDTSIIKQVAVNYVLNKRKVRVNKTKYIQREGENVKFSQIPSPTGNIPRGKSVRTWYKTVNILNNITEAEA